ncbi:MAG: alpha/beta hydrolase fold domain-containing protein [Terriglobia bacterium]
MISLIALLSYFAAPRTACSPLPAQGPDENLSLLGIHSGIVYKAPYELDAFAPAGEPRPAAMIVHGSSGNRSTHVNQLFPLLDRSGFAWFSVDYGSVDDLRAALDYIRCPGRFSITRQMVLIGEDTGAAAALAFAEGGDFAGVMTIGAKLPEGFKAHLPPATRLLMIQGTADETFPAPQIESFCRTTAGCKFFPVQGAIHNFENWHPDQWHWKEELTAWLRGDRRGLWKDLVYSRPGGRDLLLDAYVPEGEGPFPAVVIVHGGGWEAGDKITYVSPVFPPLAQAGFTWFSIDYRLTPYVHIPEQLEDVCTAVRFVRQHAAWFHVDPTRMALLGESASGHLVAQTQSTPRDGCQVQGAVLFYGVYNFTRWTHDPELSTFLKQLFTDPSDATLRKYSPFFQARASLPPMLLIQGTADELYEGTMEYDARLKEVHARHDLILLENAPHGMENWEGHPEWMFYKQEMVKWLKEHLGGQKEEGKP